jgi:signal transduction histidine kinase
MTPLASEKGIALRAVLAETELPATVDIKRIRQVLLNLLSNSIKFTFKGGIIVTAGRENPGFVVIKVEDTGTGMDKEHMDNLFDPYYHQTRELDKASGLGIGLSLSKIFVELHKGKIRAESTFGKGTTFSFSIPSGEKNDGGSSLLAPPAPPIT